MLRLPWCSVGLVAAGLASAAAAAPAVDQSHVITQSVGGILIDEGISPAQTFTIGAAGLLSQIDVQLGRNDGNIGALSLEVWPVTAGGPSGSTPLFTLPINPADVPAESPSAALPYVEVDVSSGQLMVAPGELYAVAISGTAASDGPHSFWNRGYPGYDTGATYFRSGAGSWNSLSVDFDFGFRTWVDATGVPSDSLVLTPVVDAEATLFDSGAAIVNFNDYSISVNQETPNGGDSRGLFEFDMSALPSGARIESATFSFANSGFTHSQGSYPIVELYGYEGDGMALASNARDLSVPLGSSGPIETLEVVNVALQASAVDQLIAETGVLGLTAYQASPREWLSIAASEYAESFPGSFQAPTLTIQYTIPAAPDLPPGDYNGDAYVNAADYTVWRDALGATGVPRADGDGDGDVDQGDYDVWMTGYGVGPDAAVRNGGFDTGDLSDWEVVIEPNTDVSFGFPRVESFDVDGDGQASDAMRVRLGRFDTGSPGGVAAIEQELLLAAGDYEFSADIASQSLQDFGNTGPGNYELIFDGEVIDQVLLNGTTIEGFEVIRDQLHASLTEVEAGYHSVRLAVSRGATNSRAIYNFFDNVTFSQIGPAQAIPAPGALSLLGALAAVAPCGRRRPV